MNDVPKRNVEKKNCWQQDSVCLWDKIFFSLTFALLKPNFFFVYKIFFYIFGHDKAMIKLFLKKKKTMVTGKNPPRWIMDFRCPKDVWGFAIRSIVLLYFFNRSRASSLRLIFCRLITHSLINRTHSSFKFFFKRLRCLLLQWGKFKSNFWWSLSLASLDILVGGE